MTVKGPLRIANIWYWSNFRFRDKFNVDLTEKNFFDRNVFASFSSDFEKILRAVENATAKEKQAGQKMKSFVESAKSQKTIASLIQNPLANNSKASIGVKLNNNIEDQFDLKENIEPVSVVSEQLISVTDL